VNRIEEIVATALAGLQDDTVAMQRLRLVLEMAKREKKQPAETSGVRTLHWHPLDRLARRPASLPSDAVADAWVTSNLHDREPGPRLNN